VCARVVEKCAEGTRSRRQGQAGRDGGEERRREERAKTSLPSGTYTTRANRTCSTPSATRAASEHSERLVELPARLNRRLACRNAAAVQEIYTHAPLTRT
jgi:hypothetical protein